MSDPGFGERRFDRAEWAALRAHEPTPLDETDLGHLQGIGEPLSLAEIEDVYVPLARLLHLRAGVTRAMHDSTGAFLGRFRAHAPFVIGVAGSVAVGKSTTSRVLRAVLARTPEPRRVEIVTTDGFLYPNAELERRGLMGRKGFPESFDTARLIRFLADLKAGQPVLEVPVYDHAVYDVVDRVHALDRPDVVIVEGLNVLQVPGPGLDGRSPSVVVSDFFDFSIYVDADPSDIEAWYVDRFRTLVAGARDQPTAFFHRFRDLDDATVTEIAVDTWTKVNLVNLHQNVQPTRDRADLVLEKGGDHAVRSIVLRLR